MSAPPRATDPPPAPPGRFPVIAAAAMVMVLLGVAALHEVQVGRAELQQSESDAARSDWPDAIVHARGAAQARAPGSPFPERAARRLQAIGFDAEVRSDDDTALLAYGALRTASISTTALPGSARTAWRKAADDGIARIAARRAEADRSQATPEGRQRSRALLSDLAEDGTPSAWSFASLSLAALAMLGGFGRLAWSRSGSGRAAAQLVVAAGFMAALAVVLLN